jgi:hypothetical protein
MLVEFTFKSPEYFTYVLYFFSQNFVLEAVKTEQSDYSGLVGLITFYQFIL